MSTICYASDEPILNQVAFKEITKIGKKWKEIVPQQS